MTFDGNCADVSSMETILRMVERKYGKARLLFFLASRRASQDVSDPHE
jgi:hypothetical protein